MTITSTEFAELSHDEVVQVASSHDVVRLHIDSPLEVAPLKVGLLLAAANWAGCSLEVSFAKATISRAILLSLRKSLLGPLLWGHGHPEPLHVNARGIRAPLPALTDADHHLICAHPSAFDATHPDAFQADLASSLRAARISLSGSILGAVTTIGFEANSNAEEHGAFRQSGTSADTFRFFAMLEHATDAPPTTVEGDEYLRQYLLAGHAKTRGWLELIVVDAGPGIASPSYELLAKEAGWDTQNIYDLPTEAERARLQLVLDDITSTKGRWGRVLNRHTSIGQGTRFIKFRLATVRGFASVRAGRCIAHWHYPAVTSSTATQRGALYDVDQADKPLFHGTAWQVLVPLNPQLDLRL